MTHICRIAAPSSSATTVARKITTRAAVQFPAKTMGKPEGWRCNQTREEGWRWNWWAKMVLSPQNNIQRY